MVIRCWDYVLVKSCYTFGSLCADNSATFGPLCQYVGKNNACIVYMLSHELENAVNESPVDVLLTIRAF